jgi:hypothetical protein
MSVTPRLSLPLLAAAQAQKHVTHNEALMRLDAVTQMCVEATVSLEPSVPREGEAWIVAADAVGSFAGRRDAVALRQDGAWVFLSPSAGWRVWSRGEACLLVHDGARWRPAAPTAVALPFLGLNAVADAGARLAVKSASAWLSHEDGGADARLTINKAAPAAAASIVFQTGWSGRVELGTPGADQFRLRTSADGSAWTTRLTVDPVTGFVGVGRDAPAARLDVATAVGSGLRLSAANTGATFSAFDAGADSRAPTLDVDFTGNSDAAAVTWRVFRATSTTGVAAINVYRANSTATLNAQIAANGASFVNVVGNFGVGVSNPDFKLTVAGHAAPSLDNAYSLGSSTRRWSAIYAATGVVNASDARAKTDIAPCPLGLDFLRALTPRIYRWRVGGLDPAPAAPDVAADGVSLAPRQQGRPRAGRRAHLGFLAQDVKAALDAAGVDCGLWTRDDPDDPDSAQALRPDQLLAPLVRAVQEIDARLRALESLTRA